MCVHSVFDSGIIFDEYMGQGDGLICNRILTFYRGSRVDKLL